MKLKELYQKVFVCIGDHIQNRSDRLSKIKNALQEVEDGISSETEIETLLHSEN